MRSIFHEMKMYFSLKNRINHYKFPAKNLVDDIQQASRDVISVSQIAYLPFIE